MTQNLNLGKTPARPEAVKLKLSTYLKASQLPKIPSSFGHEKAVAAKKWSMLGNDKYGCCVWAGAAHETMMWNAANGVHVGFNTKGVLSDYAAVTGFTPSDPNSDQGTDMTLAAKYRQKTGVVDSNGKRHKIRAYLALRPGYLEQCLAAAYLFGAVGIGIRFPGVAMDQFNAGKPWDVVKGAKIDGGHYIPFVARRDPLEDVVTWGRLQGMTPAFFSEYCDEGLVYLTDEYLKNSKSPEGFDLAALQDDFHQLTGTHLTA